MTMDTKEREPDATIKAARSGWMIRLTAGGVPVTDFLEVAYSIDRWDDWCQAWCERAAVYEKIGRACLAENQNVSAAMHLVTAAVEYHFAK